MSGISLFRPRGAAQPRTATRPLRVLMIAPTSFFGDYGCHVRILEETRILQQYGHQVAIVTYQNGQDVPGIDIRRTMSVPYRRNWEVGSSWHKLAYDVLLGLRSLTCLWQVKPDIIHAHLHEGALIGGMLSALWGVPTVFDFQGSLTAEMVDHHFLPEGGLLYRPVRWLESFINRISPRILTSSSQAAGLLLDEFNCCPEKVRVVPDCVNPEVFAPPADPCEASARRRAWDVPLGRTVVVYLGLLAEYQGVGHLLRAAKLLLEQRDDLHFVIAGYPNVGVYAEQAQALGISDHVTFPGRVRYADAPRILSLGDIAVAPKLSKSEGAGKLLNYMAMALPTVAFDTPVSHEYLGEYGVFAEMGSVEELARCLGELASDPQRREWLGAQLRQRAQERFTWDLAAGMILEEYRALLA